jgi:hypothetical protein
MIELFKTEPGFPFPDYDIDVQQYIGAQRYWLHLVRQAPGFDAGRWAAVVRPVDIPGDQARGLLLWLRSAEDRKEIFLSTSSFEACVRQHRADHAGMSPRQIREARETWGYEPDEATVRGLTEAEAKAEVQAFYKPFLAWVEPAVWFRQDRGHPDGGTEVAVERLILTSEIAPGPETQALRALQLFLDQGRAQGRVNRAFAGL